LGARLSLALVGTALLIVIMFALVAKIIRPYQEASAQKRDLAATRTQVAALDQQNQELRQKIAYLNTREGMEREARGLGYTLPGEVPFFVESSALPQAAAPAPRPVDQSTSAKLSRFWSRLFRH
jgi:cell division protein FtsB